MFCLNCGNQLPEHARFCSRCGHSVAENASSSEAPPIEEVFQPALKTPKTAQEEPRPEVPTPTPKREKRKKKRPLKLIIVLILILAVAAAGVSIFFINQKNIVLMDNFIEAVESGNVNEAISIYDTNITDTGLEEDAPEQLQTLLDNAANQFENGETAYVDALRTVESIEQISIARGVLNTEQFAEIYTRMEALGNSRVAYTTGLSYQDEQKYPDAIAQFSAVLQDDTYCYEDAQARITECQKIYKENTLEQVNAYIADGQHSDAMHLLDNALEVLPNDTDLSALRDTSYSNAVETAITEALAKAASQAENGDHSGAIKTINASLAIHQDDRLKTALSTYQIQYALVTADTCVSNGDYPGAITAIADGLESNPENVDLLTAYSDYYDTYVADVISEADAYAAALDYDNAISIVRQALENLPEDETLSAKLDTLKASKPISLSSLDALNTDDWRWNDGSATDPFGNDYSALCNYVIATYDGYIEYRLYGEYKTLTGLIAPQEGIGENGSGQVQIYADDTLVYNSPTIQQKTDAFRFSTDISGAEYIKIMLNVDPSRQTFILADVQLWP